ncbi:ribosomal oxygenase 1-like [Uloborus diversus]|uniref:ribosomal oxygenase 1-like n=1 Tax=Uloborus diversus TaxID=327109 RepID=UPI002409AC48|nr:ribosomal oxygenase 1-like [Uloborus diversus]
MLQENDKMKPKDNDLASMSAFAVYSQRKKLTSETPESVETQPKRMKLEKNVEVSDVRDTEEINVEPSTEEIDHQDFLPELQEAASSSQKHPGLALNKNVVPCGNFVAEKSFKWMIFPMSPEKFFDDFWEKNYAHISRNDGKYWNCLYSCEDFDRILKNNRVEFGKDIDITEYYDGVRKTVEAEGIANRNAVWSFYQDNCTIRMKNPQAYHDKLYQLLSHLQEYFGSFMGVNMYLTPPESQGFAPHYDDIEAFVLQIEGRKLWKIYAPRNEDEKLPRVSSPNFTQDEIGIPIFEVELKAGDMLYFPRGFIHQAKTVGDCHSLHLTISTYQNNTWGDLMQVMLPRALEIAMANDVEFRESLPKDYLDHVGMAYENKNEAKEDNVTELCYELSFAEVCIRFQLQIKPASPSPSLTRIEKGIQQKENHFSRKMKKLSKKLLTYLPVDEAADIHAKNFIHSCLPPAFIAKEKKNSVHGNSYSWRNGVISTESLKLETRIRLIRKRIFRMVFEEDSVRLYHTLANSKEYKENEIKYVEADETLIPAVQFLLHSFPNYIEVADLPLETDNDKLLFANDLYNNGFLMTEEPLQKIKE